MGSTIHELCHCFTRPATLRIITRCIRQQKSYIHTTAAVSNTQYGAKTRQHGQHWYDRLILPWKTKVELAEHLVKNHLHEDERILVLNKPNGIPMHALKYTEMLPLDVPPPQEAEFSISSSLPVVKEMLGLENLTPAFSQNRMHSGIVVLAKDKEALKLLQTYFRHARTNKTFCEKYWAVTHGVPTPSEGADNFPIEKFEMKDTVNKWRLSIRSKTTSKSGRLQGRIVAPDLRYRTLDSIDSLNVALVEVEPTCTKWDSIQLYLLHKQAAVLGDHLYSPRLVSIAGKPVFMEPRICFPKPQKLPEEILRELDLSKHHDVHIPLHIHCRQLILPNITRRRNQAKTITITAPPPPLFSHTLDSLNLIIPTE